LAAIIVAACYTNSYFCPRSSVVRIRISECDVKVMTEFSRSTVLRKIKRFLVTCAAIEVEFVALRTRSKEFWYRPIRGSRTKDDLSIVNDVLVVIYLCENT
jgi:hypothetical protein